MTIRFLESFVFVAILYALPVYSMAQDCSAGVTAATAATQHWENGDAPAAWKALQTTFLVEECFDGESLAYLYHLRFLTATQLSLLAEAEQALEQSCKLRASQPPTLETQIGLFGCRVNRVMLELMQGRISEDMVKILGEAEAELRETTEDPQTPPNLRDRAWRMLIGILNNLGTAQSQALDAAPAERTLRRALALLEEKTPEDKETRAKILNQYGSVLSTMLGRAGDALKILQESLSNRSENDAIGRGHTLTNMATALRILGRLSEAESRQDEALRAFTQATGEKQGILISCAMNNLCVLRGALVANFDKPSCFAATIQALGDAVSAVDRLTLYDNAISGILNDESDDADRNTVGSLITEAETLIETHDLKVSSAHSLIRSQVAELQGDTQGQLSHAYAALRSAQTVREQFEATTHIILASPDIDRAEALAEGTISVLKSAPVYNPSDIAAISNNIAWRIGMLALESMNRDLLVRADKWADRAVAALGERRHPILNELRTCLIRGAAQDDIYRSPFKLSALIKSVLYGSNANPEEIFALLQRTEGSLALLTWRANLERAAHGEDPKHKRLADLLALVDHAQERICRRGAEPLRESTLASIERHLDAVGQHPVLAATISTDPVPLSAIAATLSLGEVVIGVSTLGQAGISYAVFRSGEASGNIIGLGFSIQPFAKPFDEIMAAVKDLADSVNVVSGQTLAVFPEDRAAFLFDNLFAELLSKVDRESPVPVKDVIVVIDEALLGLPFNALRAKRPDGTRGWFGLERRLAFLPSIRSLLDLPRSQNPLRRYYGVGNPYLAGKWPDIPGSRVEIKSIAKLFPADNRLVRLGKKATLQHVLADLATGPEFVALATHGGLVKDPTFGQRFGLALTPSPMGGGHVVADHLVADHLRGLDLSSISLLVLSACRTVGGGLVFNDLLAAFLGAGVQRILASQWYVDDRATRELMVNVAEAAVEGLPVDQALQRGMQRLAESERWSHPYYWAPFMMVGLPVLVETHP